MNGEQETVELTALRDEVAALRAELAAMRATFDVQPSGAGASPDGAASRPARERSVSSRREVLRRWGAAAAGATAVGLAALPGKAAAAPLPVDAAAATGDALSVGRINTFTNTTELTLPPDGNGASLFSHVLAVQDGAWRTTRIPYTEARDETDPKGVGGSAGVASLVGAYVMHGGYFQTNSSLRGSAGVVARGINAGAYGVVTSGGRAAMRLERSGLQFPPPERVDTHNEGEIVVDSNSDLWYCVATGAPGTWRKLSGAATAGQFHAITPVRAYDSRYLSSVDSGVGPMIGGDARTVSVADAYAPDTTTLTVTGAVPAGATAVAYNVTVADTGPAGFLAVSPGDATAITASTINWSGAGSVLANSSVVKLDASRRIKVFCRGSATHVIIDVLGFYR
jgi:hypothetical protein